MAANSGNEKNRVIAEKILEHVGGKDNISIATHCMTRLRLNFKDESIPNVEKIQKIPGVLGVIVTGGQMQIIIGQTVDKVYAEFCDLGDFSKAEKFIQESGEAPKKEISLKNIGGSIFDGLAGCLTPLIPMLMVVSMFKLLSTVLGPSLMGVLAEDSHLLTLFTLAGDAGFYFMPIMVGYTASKRFNVTPIVGMLLAAIMIHPTLLGLVEEGSSFTVFGIPAVLQNYTSTVLPVILSVWAMSYVERFFKKVLPSVLRTVFAPFLTILVMLPVALCVLGPAGAILGNVICGALLSFSNYGGIVQIIAIAVIAAIWQFLVLTGMHTVMISTLILVFTTYGTESVIMPAACISSIAVSGMCLGAALRMKNKEERTLSFGYLVAGIAGGVTEPGLYGLAIKYRRPIIGMMAGAFAGGLYAGILGVTTYNLIPVANLLCLVNFAGGPVYHLIHGTIACGLAFVVAAIVTYVVGVNEESVAS